MRIPRIVDFARATFPFAAMVLAGLVAFGLEWGLSEAVVRLSDDELLSIALRFHLANQDFASRRPSDAVVRACVFVDDQSRERLLQLLRPTSQPRLNIPQEIVCASGSTSRVAFGFQFVLGAERSSNVSGRGLFFELTDDDFLNGLPALKTVGKLYLRGTVDTMARHLERAAFNVGSSDSAVRLCTGTRTPLPETSCAAVESFQARLLGPLGIPAVVGGSALSLNEMAVSRVGATDISNILGKRRLWSLFFGVIQAGTLALFVFAMMRIVLLWFAYVRRVPQASLASSGRGIHDRMRVPIVLATRGSVAGSQSRPAAIGALESVRQALESEAAAIHDQLDMIGDTMLKLAFLGTVYGISIAMFAARILDSSDPVLRLAAKSEMYSGIGVGFGATFVGIVLSILAASARSWLSSRWHHRIDDAYTEVLNQLETAKDDALDEAVKGIKIRSAPLKPDPIVPVPRPQDPLGQALLTLGIIVIVGFAGGTAWAAYVFIRPFMR